MISNENTSYLEIGIADFDELSDRKRISRTAKWTNWTKHLSIRPPWQDKTKTNDRSHHWDLYGWRMGVFIGCCLSALVLCCNFALLLIAADTNAGQDFGLDSLANLMVDDERIH